MFDTSFLFKPSARDEQVTWLDPVVTRSIATLANVNVSVGALTVPVDRAFILTTLWAQGIPGGAQTMSNLRISVFPATANIQVVIKQRNDPAGVAGFPPLDWQGELILPPGWFIQAAATFSAGAVANSVELSVGGVLIPPGNIQRV